MRRFPVLLSVLIMAILLSACGSSVLEHEEAEDDHPVTYSDTLLSLGENSFTLRQTLAFFISQGEIYESSYGEDIWTRKVSEDMSFEDFLMDRLRSHIALICVSSDLALSRGITVSDSDNLLLADAAEEFYSGIDRSRIAATGLTYEDVLSAYTTYHLAEMGYADTIESFNTELSEDESRVITLKQLRIYFNDMNDDAKAEKLLRANEALTKLQAGEDFDEVSRIYSETPSAPFSVSRDDLPMTEENAAFSLAAGEISDIVTASEYYVIYKCVDSYDENASALHRSELIKEREEDVYKEQIRTFLKSHPLKWNEDAWNFMSINGEAFAETDFYSIYRRYFS